MKKRPWSKQLYMLPARFLHPWDVLEMDILDMKVVNVVTAGLSFMVRLHGPSCDCLLYTSDAADE